MVERLNYGRAKPDTALIRWMERDQARRSAALYAPSSAIADAVARDWGLPRPAIQVIPNSIDVTAVARLSERKPPFDLPDRFVVFLGRLEHRKGLDVLGSALATTLTAFGDHHAVLIGRDPGEEDGRLMERFRARIDPVSERVHLLGELPQRDAFPIVARARVALVPSLWEAFGYVCVEAMAVGTPVIASDTGGLAEIVREGSGWLVPPADADALARRLTEVLADAEAVASASERAVTRAAFYDIEVIGERVESLLQEVVANKAKGFERDLYSTSYPRYFRAEDRKDPFKRLYEQKAQAVAAAAGSLTSERILDAGGGYGRIARRLSSRHEVVLCDLSHDMLLLARGTRDELMLVRANATSLPLAPDSFDTVIAIDLLVHLPDWRAGLRELTRVLKPGGRLIFDTTSASPWWVLSYPSYVNFRPKRLALTMMYGGVLPEWRGTVTHQLRDEVPPAAHEAGLVIDDTSAFGPRWAPKWHLWLASKSP
jgi:glycogen(starch) synthase